MDVIYGNHSKGVNAMSFHDRGAGSNPAVPVNNMAVNYYSVPKLLKCGGNLAGNSTTLRCGNSNIANPHSLVGSLSKVTQSCGFYFCKETEVMEN